MNGRKIAIAGCVASVCLLLGAMSSAAPAASPEPKAVPKTQPTSAPIEVRPIDLRAPVQITGFQRGGPIEAGSLGYQVTLHNAGAAPAAVKLHFARAGSAETQAAQSITVPAKSDAIALVKDGVAFMNCGIGYTLWLEGDGADPTKRGASLMTTCTFDTKVTDSLASMTPDRRHDQETGRAFFANTTAPTFHSCGSMHVEVDFVNHSPNVGKNLEISLDDVDGRSVWQGGIGNVAAGATHHVKIDAGTIQGAPGNLKLRLIDPVQSLGGKVASQSVQITLNPQCSAQAGLLPTAGH